jgi:hypothetical protein
MKLSNLGEWGMGMTTEQQTLDANNASQSKSQITPSTEKDILDEEKESLPNLSRKHIRWIVIGTILSIPFYVTFMVLLMKSWQDRSNFGEMFGGLNTLFSGLAFIGVIYAIFLQRRELEFQRQELILTRTELKRSAEAQEKSEKALKDQVEELVHQRRLSILPGFILYFKADVDDYPTIKNIGIGVALNVKLEPIPLAGSWDNYFIHFTSHPYILNNEEKRLNVEDIKMSKSIEEHR